MTKSMTATGGIGPCAGEATQNDGHHGILKDSGREMQPAFACRSNFRRQK